MWSLIYWHRHLPRCIKQGPQNNLYASSSWTQPIHTYSGSCRHPHTCLACLSLALLEHCHLICSVIHHLSPRPFFSHSATDSCLPNRSAPRIVFLQYKYQKVTLYKLLMTSCFLKDKFGAPFHGIQLAPGYLSHPGYLSLQSNIQSCASASSTTTEYSQLKTISLRLNSACVVSSFSA